MNRPLDLPVPARMRMLDRDPRTHHVVPWFVHWQAGEADFRVIAPGKIERAIKERRCWLCGEPLGRMLTFVIGPMCAINRISSEPPSHTECALYAVRVCPFLTRPKMRRNEKDIPEDTRVAGISIRRNPGVALVWVTRTYGLVKPPGGGVLIRVGDPEQTLWFAEGRPATRAEILASIDSGLPLLREQAEEDGPAALRRLEQMTATALTLVPA